jgi:hypothetical protein
MEIFQAIELRRTRDFSRKMNATFEFLRHNFKQLSKSILFIAGPPILVASVLVGSFFGDIFSIGRFNPNNVNNTFFLSVNFWAQIIVTVIFFMVSFVAAIATINNFILLYGEKRSNQIEVSEVWERVKKTFWMYMSTTVLFTILAILVYVAMVIPAALLAAVNPVLVFLAIIACMCVALWLMISSSLVYIVRTYEDVGFMESIARSFSLVRGKWWSTFGLIMLLYIIIFFVSYFMMIGWSIVTVAASMHSTEGQTPYEMSGSLQTISIIFFSVYYLLQMLMYALPTVGIAFQYFNLVERKEAKNLISQIQNLGQTQAPTSGTEEQY